MQDMQVDSSVTSKQTPCWPVPVYLKEPFKQEIDKTLQAGILRPVHISYTLDTQLCVSGGER